jgi:CheY-like chemotaxis protein
VRVQAKRAADPTEEGREPAYDRLARLACTLLGAPLALVVLRDGDRQALKGQHGLPAAGVAEPPLDLSFRDLVAPGPAGIVVEDVRASSDWATHPRLRRLGVGSFASVPLLASDGLIRGGLWVLQPGQRRWTPDDLGVLQELAAQATEDHDLRMAAEAELERARVMGRLAGGITHEFNNLLTTILGHAALLLEEAGLSPRGREDVGQIQRASERAATLVRQLLPLRGQSGGYGVIEGESGSGSHAAPSEQSAESGGPHETILLVEDEAQVRELTHRVLERAGYTVLAAGDAEAAGALADRHAGHIHLLLTDMMLPSASGRELAARLSIHRPAVKVLYISGSSDEAIARHRLLQPGTELLEKPFSLDRLLHTVRQVLRTSDGVCRR